MFNNVILDVAIGIVFIFLLYSLLATSIQEGIATMLGLRARTLKDGIVNGMLCNTPSMSRWESIGKGILSFFKEAWYLLGFKRKPVENVKLGHQFYDHPLIKNYGSNQIFPTPSYIPTGNFSTVLIDLFKADFAGKIDRIAAHKFETQSGTQSQQQIADTLKASPDIIKIKELLAYYKDVYANAVSDALPDNLRHIEEDTLRILVMHFNNSLYTLENFEKKLENWFDDTMDRVSGWYKRRTQFILFGIGIFVAIAFNVDVIQIAGKLSTDKDAREQMVQMAIRQADAYKDDPRVKRLSADTTKKTVDSLKVIQDGYNKAVTDARKTIDSGIVKANQLMALGWGDYGMKLDSARLIAQYFKADSTRLPLRELKHPAFDSLLKRALVPHDNDIIADSVLDLLAHSSRKTGLRKIIADSLLGQKFIVNDARVKVAVDTFRIGYKKFKAAVFLRDSLRKTDSLVQAKPKPQPVLKARGTAAVVVKTAPAVKKLPTNPFARFTREYTAVRNQELLESQYGFWHSLWYVLCQTFGHGQKLIGLLITAFAICLGAPFWFDMLNKLIKLRGSGKKEEGDNNNANADTNTGKAPTPAQAGINVNVGGTSAASGEVAVG